MASKRTTYNKIRLVLFLRSYGAYLIFKQFTNKPNGRSINRLGDILNLDIHLLNKFFSSGINPRGLLNINNLTKYLIPKEKVMIYLEVEGEIINLISEKQDKENTALEDYDRAILEPALERVAGNHLKNIKDDKVFDSQIEELQRKYKNYYYATAYKYKLPTPRIIPFILRLIKN